MEDCFASAANGAPREPPVDVQGNIEFPTYLQRFIADQDIADQDIADQDFSICKEKRRVCDAMLDVFVGRLLGETSINN